MAGARGTIDASFIVLQDNWPGVAKAVSIPNFRQSISKWTYQNVAVTTPGIPRPGEKFLIYNDANASKGVAGWSTLIYLTLGTQNSGNVLAAKAVCVPEGTTLIHTVSNDPSTVTNVEGCPLCALAISAMTNGRGGYFWCGGVAPADVLIEGATWPMDGNYATDAGLAIGAFSVSDTDDDFLGFTIKAATLATVGYSSTEDTDT